MTAEHLEHRVDLPGGRVLAAAEWGDPAGIPMISHHGTPGGRLGHWHDPSIYARHGIRRITFDRAGYGGTSRRPGRSIADIVPDVVALADALGIDRFVVAGGSGGGPHALACAALLPDRIVRCLAAVTPAPWDADFDHFEGLNAGNVEEYEAALQGEEAHRRVAEREAETTLARLREGRADFLGDSYEMPESDREELARGIEIARVELEDALGGGVDGWVDDMLAAVAPWGFDVATIRCPVRLEYGRTDAFVPPANGDWLAEHVPGAAAVITDSGHMGGEAIIEAAFRWVATGRG